MTYDILFPFLKGFHLTLASFLPQRDAEGWKLSDPAWFAYIEAQKERGETVIDQIFQNPSYLRPPKTIKLVPRFIQDIKALESFFEIEEPPEVTVRSNNSLLILHGFVDASKSGFGSTLSFGTQMRYRIGLWGPDDEDKSSNWREFGNLVETLETEGQLGHLKNCIIYMATDNTTVEGCMYKGNSPSPLLHDLIVRSKKCELKYGFKLYLTHVSGERMKAQGTDGLSRGSLREGVTVGEFMSTFCPWSKSCLERQSNLEHWFKSWLPQLETLKPVDWFERGHDHNGVYKDNKGFWRIREKPGVFLWTPPPAAADAMIEELRKARLKRHRSTHVIAIPSLFTHLWKKQLIKSCDVVLNIPPGHSCWSTDQYEPLTIGFCLPFLRCAPFQFKDTPKMLRMGRDLQRMLKEVDVDPGNLLRKFLLETTRMRTLSRSVVWRLLYFGQDSPLLHRPCGRGRKGKGSKRSAAQAGLEQ